MEIASLSLIKLSSVSKVYRLGPQTQTVLCDIDMDVAAGELLAIMGASGSGKSTLMNIIGLLDRPSTGQYELNQKSVIHMQDDQLADLRNRSMGFVFQQFFLLPRLDAVGNVALPLIYRGEKKEVYSKKVAAMLAKVGMTDRALHKPNELSGGQQQRVAIARALIGEPDIVLADEPTGALDSVTGREVMDVFLQLNQEEHKTIIIVTHDPEISKQCRRVIHLKDGRIVDETFN